MVHGVTALGNGNYVVSNPGWNSRRGAVTWGNGATGVSGEVSSSNSLVGSTSFFDQVGFSTWISMVDLYNSGNKASNGNYVVRSPGWPHGNVTNAGAG
ncbi:MAG: hypothetical protein U0175_08580 [Caldilineaceae bacterium]